MPTSTSVGSTPALVLHVRCDACARPQLVPLAVPAKPKQCARCSTPLTIPELRRDIPGVDVVLAQFRQPVRIECPCCQQTLQAFPDELRRTRRCPKCHNRLCLTFSADDSSGGRSAGNDAGRSALSKAGGPGHRGNGAEASHGPPASPVFDEDDDGDEPSPIVYGAQPTGQSERLQRPRLSIFTSPRATFWVVYLTLQFLPLLLGFLVFLAYMVTGLAVLATVGAFFIALSCFWIFPGFSLWIFLTPHIVPFFVSSIRCPGCQEEYEAVGRNACSCGFTDHRERHMLRFRCPKCRDKLGYMDCARCGSTILLRTRFG